MAKTKGTDDREKEGLISISRPVPDLMLPLLAVDVEHDLRGDQIVRLEGKVAPFQMLEPLSHEKLHREVSFSTTTKKKEKDKKGTSRRQGQGKKLTKQTIDGQIAHIRFTSITITFQYFASDKHIPDVHLCMRSARSAVPNYNRVGCVQHD